MSVGINLPRRLASEALGTALLVATVVGSGVMADGLTADTALALLANALATGAVLVVLITIFAPLSGAHFNPAVSLVMALRGTISPSTAVLYAAAQICGGIAGTLAAHLMFGLPAVTLSEHMRAGPAQLFSEGVATFGLLLVIMLGARQRETAVAWLVGLYITGAYWFTASTSFANPAVTIARALTDSFSGIRPADVPAFIAAQIAGALIAMMIAVWLTRPSTSSTSSSPSSSSPSSSAPTSTSASSAPSSAS